MRRAIIIFCLFLLCTPAWTHAGCRQSRIDDLCAAMAEELATSIQVRLDRGAAIMAVSFVDLHHLEQTSDLGRILGEGIGDSFHHHGYRLVEPRLRSHSLTTHDQRGEFALSRDSRHIAPEIDVQAMLTGTYALADGGVFVSARIIDARDKSILATALCQLRLTPEVASLLASHPASPTRAAEALRPLHGPDARVIQGKLQALGLYRGKIDGIWGRRSSMALRQFKAIRGLPPEPEWDQNTQETLLSAIPGK